MIEEERGGGIREREKELEERVKDKEGEDGGKRKETMKN